MVYRNAVLALHEILPFPSLPLTMKHWSTKMQGHYVRANQTFAKMGGLGREGELMFGNFTPELLIAEGYMNEYVEALVDLSID